MIRNRYYELDAMRGIAALFVVLFHYTRCTYIGDLFLHIGCMGVDLFFIISGFVILLTIENTATIKEFVVNRFARLYPVYWTGVIMTTLLIIYLNGFKIELLKQFFCNLTMFQYFFNVSDIDGPYWTLTIELCFYFFIIFVKALNGIGRVLFWGGFSFFLSLASFFLYLIFPEVITLIVKRFPLIVYFPLFYAGILFFLIKQKRYDQFKLYVILFLTYIVQILLFDMFYHNRGVISCFEYSFVLLIIYLLMVLFVLDKLKFIKMKFIRFLGSISYSLYVIHFYIAPAFVIPIFRFIGLSRMGSVFVALIIMIILSFLINYFIEIPGVKYLKRKFI